MLFDVWFARGASVLRLREEKLPFSERKNQLAHGARRRKSVFRDDERIDSSTIFACARLESQWFRQTALLSILSSCPSVP